MLVLRLVIWLAKGIDMVVTYGGRSINGQTGGANPSVTLVLSKQGIILILAWVKSDRVFLPFIPIFITIFTTSTNRLSVAITATVQLFWLVLEK